MGKIQQHNQDRNSILAEYVAAVTLEKQAKAKVEELKPAVFDIMQESFEQDGSDRRRVTLGNQTIGTITACVSKNEYDVTDPEAFSEWLQAYDLGTVEHKVNTVASEEIYRLLNAAYGEDAIRHLFITTPKPTREAEKNIFAVEDVCIYTGMPEVIPGIKPAKRAFKHCQVRDTNLNKCLVAMTDNGGVARLLGGK